MTGLSDLCFDLGKEFESPVSHHFGCSVSSTSAPSFFVLVASFGPSAVRLNEDSVDQSPPESLHWRCGKRFLCFASLRMDVQFFGLLQRCWFYDLQTKAFLLQAILNLLPPLGQWRTDWRKERHLWCQEQEREWTTVGSKKTYAEVVRSKPTATKVSHPAPISSVFKCLSYPDNNQANYFTHRNFHSRKFAASHKPNRQCVLRWLPKHQQRLSVHSSPGAKSLPKIQICSNSNSNSPVQPPTLDLGPSACFPGPSLVLIYS